jgi:DNA-binding NtrC family response regulator
MQNMDHSRLVDAMNVALSMVSEGCQPDRAIYASLVAAAEGLACDTAWFALFGDDNPRSVRLLSGYSRANRRRAPGSEIPPPSATWPTSTDEVILQHITEIACTSPGVWSRQGPRVEALEGHSVLYAPVLAGMRVRELGVIGMCRPLSRGAFGEQDRAWLKGYSVAVGFCFSHHLAKQRLPSVANEPIVDRTGLEIVGDSSWTRALIDDLCRVYVPALSSRHPEPILIRGERGCGKDLVARYIHAHSTRHARPFVVVNGAEVTDELATSRFFGHRKGSFTGALQDEPGAFQAAQGGVLFLDEVGDLSLRAQACLLRVMENRTVIPVGGTKECPVDVAVLLATNRNLEECVHSGSLREDFYDRFRTQCIRIKSLRERPLDVPALLEHFVHRHEERMQKRTLGLAPDVRDTLISYPWPGNVREIDRTCSLLITHAMHGVRIDRALITRCCPHVLSATPNPSAVPLCGDELAFDEAVQLFKRELIRSRLHRHEGDARASRTTLRLSKSTFYRYLKTLDISHRVEAETPAAGGARTRRLSHRPIDAVRGSS